MSVLTALVLLANGLSAGVLVGTQLGGWPLLVALPPDRYVHAHAFFSTRYDPFMPVCLITTVLGDAALAVFGAVASVRAAQAVAALLALAVAVISLTKNVPVNKWIRTVDPDRLPADFAAQDPRPSWGRWNRVRSLLAVFALVANCAAVVLQP
ncbi:MAG TPA: DUF1772 domain-containing protein [Kutzneria sp.]|nr:DUF1772 domain-containing protein [Kutzneria sp.]